MSAGLTAVAIPSLADLDAPARRRLYGGRAEGVAYYAALADKGSGNAAIAVAGPGGATAASPTFEIAFNAEYLVPAIKRVMVLQRRLIPRAGIFTLAGLGSVHANELAVSIEPALGPAARDAAFEALLAGFEAAGRRDVAIVKDIDDRDAAWADPLLRRRGYARIAGLPLAWLHLPFASVEAYLKSLSFNARRSLRRNVRDSAAIRTEVTTDIAALADQLDALAAATHARATTQFGGVESFPPDFFPTMAASAPEHTRFILHWLGEALIGFSFCQIDQRAVFGKTLGLRYPEARDHHLYFRNFIEAVRLTIAEGRQWLCLGQLNYDAKIHWGARLARRWIYFKPRPSWRPAAWLFRPLLKSISLDKTIPPADHPAWFGSEGAIALPPTRLMHEPAQPS